MPIGSQTPTFRAAPAQPGAQIAGLQRLRTSSSVLYLSGVTGTAAGDPPNPAATGPFYAGYMWVLAPLGQDSLVESIYASGNNDTAGNLDGYFSVNEGAYQQANLVDTRNYNAATNGVFVASIDRASPIHWRQGLPLILAINDLPGGTEVNCRIQYWTFVDVPVAYG